MRILFVTPFLPYPPAGGSSIVTYNFLQYLTHHHDVTLTFPASQNADVADGAQRLAKRLPLQMALGDSSPRTHRPPSFQPRHDPVYAVSSPFAEHLRRTIREGRFDVLHFDRLATAVYRPYLGPLRVATVVLAHDAEFWVREQCWNSGYWVPRRLVARAAKRLGVRTAFYACQSFRLRRREISLLRNFHRVMTLSNIDEAIFKRHGLANTVTVAPGVELQCRAHAPVVKQRYDLIFGGEYRYFPNLAAAKFLLDRIFPLIADLPVRCVLAGPGAPEELQKRSDGARIVVTGFVERLDDLLGEGDIFVVPLQMGSGVKVKVLTALSAGLPVVTSPHGGQGIALTDGVHALVARSADEFAGAVRRLINNLPLRRRLGLAGRELISNKYSIEAAGQRLEAVLKTVVWSERAAMGRAAGAAIP